MQTSETALDEVRRLRALLATYTTPIVPTPSSLAKTNGGGGGGGTGGGPAPLVVCGPSGVGKGTLIKELKARWEGKFRFSVSYTTREPREVRRNQIPVKV